MAHLRLHAALTALVAVLTLAATGCGGEADPGAAADLAPAGTSVFVTVNTDFEGEQWERAGEHVRRFPGGRNFLESAARDAMGDKDFERDVKPALGEEVAFVMLDGERTDDLVALTEPPEPERFRELVTESEKPGVVAELGNGWWAAAQTQDALDRFLQAREQEDSLADTDGWDQVADTWPEEALVTVYTAPGSVERTLRLGGKMPPEASLVVECLLGGAEAPAGAFAVVAEEGGLRLTGASENPDAYPAPDESESQLDDVLPGDGAVAVMTSRDLGEQLRAIVRCAADSSPELQQQLAQLELVAGASLEEDVLPLLDGETVAAVYAPAGAPATPIVVTTVDDHRGALATLDRIVERARALDARVGMEETSADGVAARRITLGGAPVFAYGAVDGRLGFSRDERPLALLRGDAAPLAENEGYSAAREAAGAPDEDAGALYVDVPGTVAALLATFGGDDFAGMLAQNLEPLRSLYLWSEVDDDTLRFDGLIRIE